MPGNDRSVDTVVREVCAACGRDPTRMLDIVRGVQRRLGWVPEEAVDRIAAETGAPRAEVAGVVSFYAFFADRPQGRIVIRLCEDVIDKLHGAERVAEALVEELGVGFDETTPDGLFTLAWTPCIGMSDQAPAALVDDVVITRLSRDRARQMVRELRGHGDPHRLVRTWGDGNNAHPLVRAMVENNIRHAGPVVLDGFERGRALEHALRMSPIEVIREIKIARLRGRGGAGFPTGMKWEFTRAAPGERKVVICNADEGEPGTFKDRVILTERADLMLEGLTVAAYAIGADEGIVYLRGEYAYLLALLEDAIERRRRDGLLGRRILGRDGFDFDIRVQLGAGAYMCGEETGLIASCEGRRGDAKNRPPFPAQQGYLGRPTSVNNVETLCCAARIVERGAGWFAGFGTKDSTGTKLFSVSGDCRRPGVYELPFGTTLGELLERAGADDIGAVQVGGPSGRMVGRDALERRLSFEDLPTGGSVMVFDTSRDPLWIVDEFMRFFVEESCGFCTPCRVGNVVMHDAVRKVRAGQASAADVERLRALAGTVRTASRCGLGQTSPNPVLSSLDAFPERWRRELRPARRDDLLPTFDPRAALRAAELLAGRSSTVFPPGEEDAR
ncbi:MAG: NADH:ubiquinone oxidoreductase [Acidobacteria bacterium]|nr:MAG: NADH:ubiquinone oxidoreductase [Acidobacteriota bacterium]